MCRIECINYARFPKSGRIYHLAYVLIHVAGNFCEIKQYIEDGDV